MLNPQPLQSVRGDYKQWLPLNMTLAVDGTLDTNTHYWKEYIVLFSERHFQREPQQMIALRKIKNLLWDISLL